MNLILIRHGESKANKRKILQGQIDSELSKTGVEQAKKLSERLKHKKIDVAYSSDLKRAKNTAKEILKHHPQLKLNLDKRLRELNLGELQGKPAPSNLDWNNLPSSVETKKQFYSRVQEFFQEIHKKHKNQTVLIAFHGGTKRTLLSIIHKIEPDKIREWEKPKNTGMTEITIKENGNFELTTHNCTKHLD